LLTRAGAAACALGYKTVKTVRGQVAVDVVVQDKTQKPHQLIFCECKLWKRNVSKATVHSFRTVLNDSGATLGYIISEKGFQSGAKDAARKANVRLVTWRQFQEELYQRWFGQMEARLTHVCDVLYDLMDFGIEERFPHNLVSEALESASEADHQEFSDLTVRYVTFSLSSNSVAAGIFREFPLGSNDPNSPPGSIRSIDFRSARHYFDTMFGVAPRAFRELAGFLKKRTNGRCGTQGLFRDSLVGRVQIGQSTMTDVEKILGRPAGLNTRGGKGERWHYSGARTRFRMPTERPGKIYLGSAHTSVKTLVVDFNPKGIVERIEAGQYERNGVARL
jgi:hypothetical protein